MKIFIQNGKTYYMPEDDGDRIVLSILNIVADANALKMKFNEQRAAEAVFEINKLKKRLTAR